MKLTFILLITALLRVNAASYAQEVSITVKNTPVKEVFDKLTKQTGYNFICDADLVKEMKPITINVKNTPLKDLLDQVFKNQSVNIIFNKDHTVVITDNVKNSVPVAPAAITVIGVVTDEKGTTLPGVNVVEKGTTNGVVTSATGTYSLKVTDKNATLVFSFIGYIKQEIKVGDKTKINVQLNSDVSNLQEVVVVSVGYGTLDKKEVSSSIAHVSGKDLLSVSSNDPLMALQGKVAGLTISNTGSADPNSTSTVQLRGVSSRNAGLGPLYVINGVPGGNIDNINQEDIESIDVLKGGAAAAIYGTRGSNGVIIITTKRGSAKPRLSYNAFGSFDFITNKLNVLTHDQFIADRVNAKPTQGVDFGSSTDWLKAVSKPRAFSQKQTLQMSGGTGKTNYIATVDYRDADGIDLRAHNKQYGARVNINHVSDDGVYEATFSVAPRFINQSKADYTAFNYALTINPTIPVYNNLGQYNYINTGFFASNPVENTRLNIVQAQIKELDINGSFKVNITKNLNTMVTISEIGNSTKNQIFNPSNRSAIIKNNQTTKANYASQEERDNDQKNLEWTLNYKASFGKNNIKLLGGYAFSAYNYQQFSANNYDFPFDTYLWNNLNSGSWNGGATGNGQNAVASTENSSKLISFFGRVSYDFDYKYIFTASLRHEGSSRFGANNKWGNFPAASGAWRISEENFLKNKVSWINDLKLRVDYGVTGNQDFDNYKSLLLYGGSGYFPFNGVSYQSYGPTQNISPNLRWERAINFNAGIDFELFQNRLSGSLNYYQRTNQDLLGNYNVPVPPNLQTTTYVNVGTIKNVGLELQLSGGIVRSKNFSYDLSLTASVNSNNFVSFSNDSFVGQPYQDVGSLPAPGSPGNIQRLQEGKRIGMFYMFKSAGVDDQGRQLVYKKDGSVVVGNLGSSDDKQFVGNGLPKYNASLGNTFRYKNWDLGIFFRGNFDFQIFNSSAFYIGTPATQADANLLTSAFDPKSKYSKLTNNATGSIASSYFLESGTFVKLDNVALGYLLPINSKYLRSVRIYATGRNLHTFTKYTGGDPDLISVNGLTPGINAGTGNNSGLAYYPSTLQLLVGAQLNF